MTLSLYNTSMKKFLCGIIIGLASAPLAMHAATNLFSDVEPSDWYGPAISRLREHGIVGGYQDGTFQPNRGVSRAELAVVIDRVLSKIDPEYTTQTTEDLMEVTLYFGDTQIIRESDCGATKPLTRQIPRTSAVADAALRELFKGVTPEEEAMGVTDSFSNEAGYYGTGIDSLSSYYQGMSIQNGIATVQFAEQAMAYLNGAACSQQSVKSPIEQTLMQFSLVSEVQYSVGGRVITEWDA